MKTVIRKNSDTTGILTLFLVNGYQVQSFANMRNKLADRYGDHRKCYIFSNDLSIQIQLDGHQWGSGDFVFMGMLSKTYNDIFKGWHYRNHTMSCGG